MYSKTIEIINDTSFPLADANGNCVSFIDEAGNVQAHYTYDAFGNTVSSDGDMDDVFRFRFSSKYLDDETGLYYYGYRFYDPALGRWLNRDPIDEEGGVLLYGFVGNDGVNWADAVGLACIDSNIISPCTGGNSVLKSRTDMGDLDGLMNVVKGSDGPQIAGWADCEDCKETKYRLEKYECEIEIWHNDKFKPNGKFRATGLTAWDHEVEHAKFFIEFVKSAKNLMDVNEGVCILKDCKDLWIEFKDKKISEFKKLNTKKDSELHSWDYPDHLLEKWKKLNEEDGKLYETAQAESNTAWKNYIQCVSDERKKQ